MSDDVEDRVGQVWEVVGFEELGPWLVVGYSPRQFGVLSWELVSLSRWQWESGKARVLELSLLDEHSHWRRLL